MRCRTRMRKLVVVLGIGAALEIAGDFTAGNAGHFYRKAHHAPAVTLPIVPALSERAGTGVATSAPT